jgi:hypothetical protein
VQASKSNATRKTPPTQKVQKELDRAVKALHNSISLLLTKFGGAKKAL